MITLKKMASGITLVTEKMEHMKSASVGIWVKAGAVNEEPEIAGISHFIEHMMFKGTENRTAKEIAEDVDRIGAQINAFTGKEATCYYIKTLGTNLRQSFEILFDMFEGSVFDEEEMEREKLVIYEEMKMIQDSPDEDAHDIICELVFSEDPIGHSIIGTPDSVGRIDRGTLLNYIENQYTGDSIVVSVAGSFDQKEVEEIIEEKFGNCKGKKEVTPESGTETAPLYKVKVKDIEQTHLCLGARSMELADPDYYAFSLLNNIMGGSMSSRFFQNIREQKGLAYSVYSMNSSFSTDGYYNIYAGISHDKVDSAVEAIKEELSLLKRNGVTGEELQKGKEQLKSSYIFGQENVNSRMFSIGKNSLLLGRVETMDQVLEKIDRVTMEDIERVSAIISDIENYSGVAITNSEIPLQEMMLG